MAGFTDDVCSVWRKQGELMELMVVIATKLRLTITSLVTPVSRWEGPNPGVEKRSSYSAPSYRVAPRHGA